MTREGLRQYVRDIEDAAYFTDLHGEGAMKTGKDDSLSYIERCLRSFDPTLYQNTRLRCGKRSDRRMAEVFYGQEVGLMHEVKSGAGRRTLFVGGAGRK